MGVCTKRIDSCGDSCDRNCHFVESFMTPLARPKLHPCAPPGPRPIHHKLLHSASCRLVFSMLRLLHLYVSLPSPQFLAPWVRFGTGTG